MTPGWGYPLRLRAQGEGYKSRASRDITAIERTRSMCMIRGISATVFESSMHSQKSVQFFSFCRSAPALLLSYCFMMLHFLLLPAV